jgi:hypothetical protein
VVIRRSVIAESRVRYREIHVSFAKEIATVWQVILLLVVFRFFLLSVSFQHCSIFVRHSSTTESVYSQEVAQSSDKTTPLLSVSYTGLND